MHHDDYYSENWWEATDKFARLARRVGKLQWCVYDGPENTTKYDIPYVKIGDGPNKIVINSGVHGIEGYFGSAAQNLFLDKVAPFLSGRLLDSVSFVLIHVINGWGMEHRMREVMDKSHGGLVDLNRNFGVDFSRPDALPQNPKYAIAHPVLLATPDAIGKKNAIKAFRHAHLHDGVWAAISYGQYYEPYGLFYGGAHALPENKMAMYIYDDIMDGATSLTSIGLHTGLGRFNRRAGTATAQMLVSHPASHAKTQYFKHIFYPHIRIVSDELAVNGPTLLGDLVDCLEVRYRSRDIPIYTADFEIGTGEFPIMSPIYKRMDMGDARYDLLHYGKINTQTWKNLTESWYPSDAGWRMAALQNAALMYNCLIKSLGR